MQNPMISIIIPVYNGSNYLREAIDSALAQTYDNFEVIVVNDGSSDGGATEKIALSYGGKIRYFAKENGGVASALNLGIQNMRGDYFSWLSHDDLYYPDKLVAQWEALQARGDLYAIVYSDYDSLFMETGTITYTRLTKLYPIYKLEHSVFPVLYGLIHGCSLLIHKSHFARVGTFNEDLLTSQDYDLFFRMFRGQSLIFVPRSLVCMRRHSEQGTYTISCFYQEEESFYYKAYLDLSEKEICEIFEHPSFWYWRIDGFLHECGRPEVCNMFRKRYHTIAASESAIVQREKFFRQFQELRGNTHKLCIFCCGQYGKALRNALSDLGISINCFSDNNPQLWGQRIDGCICISPNKLRQVKEDTLIIVANHIPHPVLEQLQSMGFPYITTKQSLECFVFEIISRAKWGGKRL